MDLTGRHFVRSLLSSRFRSSLGYLTIALLFDRFGPRLRHKNLMDVFCCARLMVLLSSSALHARTTLRAVPCMPVTADSAMIFNPPIEG